MESLTSVNFAPCSGDQRGRLEAHLRPWIADRKGGAAGPAGDAGYRLYHQSFVDFLRKRYIGWKENQETCIIFRARSGTDTSAITTARRPPQASGKLSSNSRDDGHMTPLEIQRVAELLDQGSSNPEIIRSISKEMPHLTAADIQQVATVRAEELKLDAAVQFAQADASERIAGIIVEAGEISGQTSTSLAEALLILSPLAKQGHKRASALLEELKKAAPVVGMNEG